ncbi:MAG: MaoC like domain protein [Candidatus Hydrogenedentes bacterium ADurb.Bin179]|nr:MAG: MaoC like domain protein [Candidatus Hydrogenedentes bacterium ADurb.Bin179]
MEISSNYVGAVCRPLDIEITTRQCMNYAAAIDDDNPRHLDDLRPDGIIAPPMLAVSLTWRISERWEEYWSASGFPTEVLARQVHYSESLEWMRPIRPGDRLHMEGTVEAIRPHRAGTLIIINYTASGPKGELVFVERIGGLLRGVPCVDEGHGEVPPLPDGAPPEAAPLWKSTIALSKFAAHRYDGLADIHFPIHISPAFAQMVGLPGILFQGTGTLALAVREIVLREADNDPARLRGAGCRFTGMVFPGTSISVEVLERTPVAQGITCGFRVLDGQGKPVLSNGTVTVALS